MKNSSTQHFYCPIGKQRVLDALGAANGTGIVGEVGQSFFRNVVGTDEMLALPFLIAASNISSNRWRTEYQIRCIETGVHAASGTERERLEAAVRDEMVQVEKEWAFPTRESLDYLENAASVALVARSAEEQLRFGLVSYWSAFEVLAQDSFELLLNSKPSLARGLMDDESARRFFDVKNVRWDTLMEFDFDLSSRVGSMLLRSRSVDSIAAIKIVFNALLPRDALLRSALADTGLMILNKSRNLIVHRRALVDEEYQRVVPSSGLVVGQVLTPTGPQVFEAGLLVIQAGKQLLASLHTLVDE